MGVWETMCAYMHIYNGQSRLMWDKLQLEIFFIELLYNLEAWKEEGSRNMYAYFFLLDNYLICAFKKEI